MPSTSLPRRLALGVSLCALSALAEPTWPELSTPMPAQGGGENDAAVIVGVEKYLAVPGIAGASQNATDWYSYLSRTRLVPPTNIHLLRDTLATREKMRKAITEAANEVKPGGTLWFVFIGHGAPARDGKDGVLVGFDAQQDPDGLYARSLPQSELLSALAKGNAGRSLVFLDACFSGRTADGKPLAKGLQPLVPMTGRAKLSGPVTVLTAAKADEFAGQLPGVERPAFSYLLLGALRGWGDRDGDAAVTAQEAVDYVRGALGTVLKERTQTPELFTKDAQVQLTGAAGETAPDLGAIVTGVGGESPLKVEDELRKLKQRVDTLERINAALVAAKPRMVFTPDTRAGCPPAGTGEDLISQKITVANGATVFVVANDISLGTGRRDMYLYLDGVQLPGGYSLVRTEVSDWAEHSISWSGELSAGSHVISVRTPNPNFGFGCYQPPNSWGSISTAVFER
jgi:hypothetical protein